MLLHQNLSYLLLQNTIRENISHQITAKTLYLSFTEDQILIDDVKTVYHKEFDEALEEYNKNRYDLTAG